MKAQSHHWKSVFPLLMIGIATLALVADLWTFSAGPFPEPTPTAEPSVTKLTRTSTPPLLHTPIDTPAQANTRVSTNTSTATPTDSPTSTKIATLTDTPTFAQTPAPTNIPTPTDTPTPHPDLILVRPIDGAAVSADQVKLEWEWGGDLGEIEFFEARIRLEGQPQFDKMSLTKALYQFVPTSKLKQTGTYDWQVAIVSLSGEEKAVSQIRRFQVQ